LKLTAFAVLASYFTVVNAEQRRLEDARDRDVPWKRWGPYLSDRAWGTVREDYSPDGTAWEYFPHDAARSRSYRWNEDGLAGICDNHQRICFALALWNGRDAILKERPFGLTGHEGNHGEDVKEYYFYLDNTPTHSFVQCVYKYPQAAFPYDALVDENRRRAKRDPEYELIDTGVFAEQRYFDVFVEYAKASTDDVLITITATNRGPDPAPLRLLPTVWFRNTWSWGYPGVVRPSLKASTRPFPAIELDEPKYGRRWLLCGGAPALLFTENETNAERLFDTANPSPYVKDAFHAFVVGGHAAAVNPARTGTKAAADYQFRLDPGQSATVRLRLTDALPADAGPTGIGADFDRVRALRKAEADEFYAAIAPPSLSADGAAVMRQALAGLLWSKQFYNYAVKEWLDGDPSQPPPPPERRAGRNRDWTHLYNNDVISMPDKWEYPWFAAWDLAFHCVALSIVDADLAKRQLLLLVREWYMHPNGQLPAYEWAFGDVNPPVHAWAALRVYQIERKRRGTGDVAFLERVFHKLLLNFTWWVNRKDAEGMNVFQGGFLGLDNIGVFDRNRPFPTGGVLEQSDGTSWMAMFTLNMLAIALELSHHNHVYEDVASKFFEHFIYIANAMNNIGDDGITLWNEDDRFYYDVLRLPSGDNHPIKVRSMVGLIPLFAIETLEPALLQQLPGFRRRLEWFIEHRPDLTKNVASMQTRGHQERRLLSVVPGDRLPSVLKYLLDEREFLSPFGIRSLSEVHRDHPYVVFVDGHEYRVDYEPAESTNELFGGNSNWRGPIWFPLNFLLVESLQKYDFYLGDRFKVECPVGSGQMMTLSEVAADLSRRLSRIFLKDERGRRPVFGNTEQFQTDPLWNELIPFHEYFNGDTGAGLGASHQTGWTGLVAKLLQQSGESSGRTKKSK
jgi:hypothetical protein